MLRSLATLAALVALLALPAGALSMNGRTGGADRFGATGTAPVNYLRDAKYAAAPRAVQVVRVVRPGGFRYRDAGIGAALTIAVVALGAGAIILSRVGRGGHATAS
jgi:hypothetical protein